MNDLFPDCSATQCQSNAESGLASNEQAVLSLVLELGESITSQVNANTVALAAVITKLQSNIKRKCNANSKILGEPISALYNFLTSSVSENGAVISQTTQNISNQLNSQVTQVKQGDTTSQTVQQSQPVEVVIQTPQVTVVETPQTQTQQTQPTPINNASVQAIRSTQTPQSGPTPTTGDNLVSAIQALLTILQSSPGVPVSITEAISTVEREVKDFTQKPVAPVAPVETQLSVKPESVQKPVYPGGVVTGFDVPVDLDQPLAFRFAPDDSDWKTAAVQFYGPWLDRWNNADSLRGLTEDRGKQESNDPTQNDPPFIYR